MRRFFFPAGLVVLLVALTAVVLLGRHGECASPHPVAAGPADQQPVLVRNALPLSAYGPIAPGGRAVEGTLLVLAAPGAYFFRPQHQERYRFPVLGDPRDHLVAWKPFSTAPSEERGSRTGTVVARARSPNDQSGGAVWQRPLPGKENER